MREKNKKSKVTDGGDFNVSYTGIFRYGKWYEKIATVMGLILGALGGYGVSFNLAIFGELTTSMVDRMIHQDVLSSRMPLLELFGGGRQLNNASFEENMKALVEDGIAMGVGSAVIVVVCLVFCMLSVAFINWSALRQIARIRIMFVESALRQDMSWFDTNTDFNLASRISEDMLKLKEGMGEKLSIVSNLVGTAGICIIHALVTGWELALACISVVPFSIGTSVLLSNYQTRSSVREMNSYSKAGKQAEEVLKSIKTVIAFGGENKEVERYQKLLEPAEAYGRKRGLYNGLGTGFNWVLTYSLNAIGLTYGCRLVLADIMKHPEDRTYDPGAIISIMFNIYMATQSITFCVPHGETFTAARAAAASIFKLISQVPVIDSFRTEGLSLRRVKGEIALENVDFSYPSRPDVKVLKNFSLRVKPGEVVALVGSSGCGKSTILQLIQRLYDPCAGSVKFDDKNVKSLNLSWLRSSLGVVGQEPVLFRGTIHDNITIGAPEATHEEVRKVSEIAYAHDFIMRLPKGYDTVIGERGASLSGGQKQRVAIARSLLREPAVLLLDEATSALDSHSERQVQAALDRASEGRTTLVVSHRLSTIINADRIICMDQGQIVEEGTHEELLQKKGFYWNLAKTDKEFQQEPDVIDVVEEKEDTQLDVACNLSSRNDVKRRSKRTQRRISRRESRNWMTPRASISSVISTGFQNYAYSCESDDESTNPEEEKIEPVSNWELLKLNGPEWHLIVIGSIAAFIQGACFPAFSILTGYSMGIFGISTDPDELTKASEFYSGLFLVVAAIAGISMCVQSTAFTKAGLRMTTRLRVNYFSSLLKQEMGYFDRASNTVGALCARLSGDTAEVQGATGVRIGLILQGFSSVFIGIVIAMCYSWKLTLVATSFLPLMVGSIWLEGIISQKSQDDERAAMEAATSIATEAMVSIRTVQSLGVEKTFLNKYRDDLSSAVVAVSQKTRWRGLVLGLGIYVPFLAYSGAAVYGTVLLAEENTAMKDVFIVNEAIMYGAYMLGQSLVYAPNFNSAKDCGARILATIRRTPRIKTEDGVKDTKHWKASGSFNLKKVEFSYPTRPHQQVLKGLDLKVDAGKTVALVGSSGCGKSTVIQLLQRFYDPDSGTIELDGRDTRTSLTLPQLRRQLGVVQQEPVLLHRSLAENIAYGDNSRPVTMPEVVAAAKAANIHSFIVSLPQGYETSLGSGGAQLSGGQKQRVCIARALVRQPRLLLLDEATSALDANSEKAVSAALEKAAKGRTCISIAHRLSTIKDADIICVVDKGEIVERGSHADLITRRGHYWKMSRTQHE